MGKIVFFENDECRMTFVRVQEETVLEWMCEESLLKYMSDGMVARIF